MNMLSLIRNSIDSKVLSYLMKNNKLVAIRDALLPKLMRLEKSGFLLIKKVMHHEIWISQTKLKGRISQEPASKGKGSAPEQGIKMPRVDMGF